MSKIIRICTISKEDLFDVKKPRYNAHLQGTGAHESKKKYTRKKKHKGDFNE